jgi:predicted secreted protein
MAARGASYAEKFSRWEVLITNTKPGVAEMPHMGEDLAELEQLLGQVRVLESQQEDLRSQARVITARIRELAEAGEKVRARMRANLNGKYGFTSEALVKFGFRPRPINRRRKVVKPPAVDPAKPPGQAGAVPAKT